MIKFEEVVLPSADMGELNPLPDIKNISYIHAGFEMTDRLTAEERKYIGFGMINTMLPYLTQDGYNRVKKPRAHRIAVLENDYLRAEFMLDYGGRMRSLYDKEKNRELLYVNSVFQVGNLGLRNAWFSGGVEFNMGIKGHNPLTCDPLFCEVVKCENGEEILCLYEYERIRGAVYSISVWLPENSRVLYIRGRIENKTDREIPMYWWSNIAVPETMDTRVIIPTDDAIVCSYNVDRYKLDKVSIPKDENGTDITYPTRQFSSRDFFYKMPKDKPKWIAAAEADGRGLLQCSTDKLQGRKLFIWGQGNGGKNWNHFLSTDKEAYIEIQAGVGTTQLEHLPMAPNSEWSWVEAYTALDCPPEKLHGDWNVAETTVTEYMYDRVGDPRKLTFPDDKNGKRTIISNGSGWGAVEEAIRNKSISSYHKFPKFENDAETKMWHKLLTDGVIDEAPTDIAPNGYVADSSWLPYLEKAPKNWFSLLHLGVTRYANGDLEGAKEAFSLSNEAKRNAWALRNLAMLERNEFDNPKAAKLLLEDSLEVLPYCLSILINYAAHCTSANEDQAWLDCEEKLTPELKANGRLRFYKALALFHLDRTDEAKEIINPDFEMADIKEGELSVSKLWFDLYGRIIEKETGKKDEALLEEKYPLPIRLDFRMHATKRS